MEIEFEELKKIHDAVKDASEKYVIKSFKPWESEGTNKEFITIVLAKIE